MLTFSCRVFFWFGDYYSVTLLAQAVLTIGVQFVLLKVALDNRPAPGQKSGVAHIPFSGAEDRFVRPYDFWQWKHARPYVLPTLQRCELVLMHFPF